MPTKKTRSATKRKPVTSLPVFLGEHLKLQKRLLAYATTKRGIQNIDDPMFQRLLRRSAINEYAVNAGARNAYARAAKVELGRFAKENDQQKFHFLTFAPMELAESLENAEFFKNRAAKSWFNCTLIDYNYIGAMEPSFYSNWPPGTSRNEKLAHWHFHAVVWGCSAERIESWVEHANRFYSSLVPGLAPAHVRHVSPQEAVGKALYAIKAPLSDYRIYPIVTEQIDPETGEVFKIPTGVYKQRKQELRPGDAAKMCKILGSRRVSELLFSGDEGDALLRKIERRARRILNRKHEARRRKLKWSRKIGQSVKVYPRPAEGIRDDETPEVFGPVQGQDCA